jgi:hypothetical protein
MAFLDEIKKHQRQRSVYLNFSVDNNPGVDWEGAVTRLYGTAYDDMGEIPVKGTVTSFGTFARSVLTMEVDLETPSVTVELTDDNHEWRRMAEPPSNQILYRWVHLMMRVLDDTGGFFDQKVAVGQIAEPTFPPGKKVSLTVQLTPGSFMGEDLPRRLVTMRDFPRCPPENVGKVVPVIYGVMSNSVRTANTALLPNDPDLPRQAAVTVSLDVRVSSYNDVHINAGSEPSLLRINIGGGYAFDFKFRQISASSSSNEVTASSWALGAYAHLNGSRTQIVDEVDPYPDPAIGSDPDLIGVSRVGWAWHTLSVTLVSSTFNPVGSSYASDGEVIVALDGTALYAGTGLLIERETATGDIRIGVSPRGDVDRVIVTGGNDTFSDSFEAGLGSWNGAWNGLTGAAGSDFPVVMASGGSDGVHYIADGPSNGGVYRDFALAVFDPNVRIGCTPTDTGTGPNMAAGAVRALLVDMGITTVVSVQNPPPPPGEAVLDESIEVPSGETANERSGAGSINVPTFYRIAALMSDGRIGTLSSIMDLDQGYDPDYPAHDAVISWNDSTTTPDSWIVWMFTDFNFHPISNPEPGARIRIIPGTPYTDPDYPPGNTFDYQVVFTSVDDGDPWETFTPLPPGGGPTLVTGFSGYRYLLAGHYLHRINQVYVRRPVIVGRTEGTPATEDEPAVEGDSITEDQQVLQQEGTDFVQEVMEINGSRYHTIRFFAAMQSDDCTTQYEVTANVEGVETNADGTGELITNGIEMVEHILLNWVFNNYRSSVGIYAPVGGRWFTDVPYSPGLLNHTSFLSAYENAFTFVVGGYLGAGMLTEQMPGTQLVTELMRSFGLDFFFDPMRIDSGGNGAWCVNLFQPELMARGSQTIFHPHPPSETGYVGIEANSFQMSFERGWHRNVVQYFAGPMYGMLADESTNEDGGYTVSNEVRDPESIAIYGLVTGDPLYLPWTRDPETAYSVAYRLLRLERYPPILVQLQTPLSGLTVSPADVVAVTHPDGTGLLGWTDRLCLVLRLDINFSAMTCTFTLRDVDALVP